ncbi:hypothetical protein IAG25_30655 [Caballeronia sp. EK]|uniref:hypothetical protein n=1 Tax=Caballeronia sp. EK TaxID=2767469 RepID=UPI001655FAFC|nr:hypothetical protein [Caballeronia sp. EK]MBC8641185.1 hypothetical protein [Caballeronia sp. EK]
MLTDEERTQAAKESLDRMIEMNRRWAAERDAEQKHADERKAQGKWDESDWAILLGKIAIGVMILMFFVLVYTTLPTIIHAIIKATGQWHALFH